MSDDMVINNGGGWTNIFWHDHVPFPPNTPLDHENGFGNETSDKYFIGKNIK